MIIKLTPVEEITVDFEVAVVITLYNKAPFIRRTLESALSQSKAPAEIVVIDDGSTDDSVARIHDLIGPRVRLVRQENAGPGPARNRGISETRQPWIAFLDGDDIWHPDHLATLANLCHKFPHVDAVVSSFKCSAAEYDFGHGPPQSPCCEEMLLDYFGTSAEDAAIWTSTVAISRSAISAIGTFKSFWPGEDVDYWIRLAARYDVAKSARVTAIYRQNTDGLMDQSDARKHASCEIHPIFYEMDQAMHQADSLDRVRSIRRFRTSWARLLLKQALLRGEKKLAYLYLTQVEYPQRLIDPLWLIALIPASVFRQLIRVRNRWRSRFRSCFRS